MKSIKVPFARGSGEKSFKSFLYCEIKSGNKYSPFGSASLFPRCSFSPLHFPFFPFLRSCCEKCFTTSKHISLLRSSESNLCHQLLKIIYSSGGALLKASEAEAPPNYVGFCGCSSSRGGSSRQLKLAKTQMESARMGLSWELRLIELLYDLREAAAREFNRRPEISGRKTLPLLRHCGERVLGMSYENVRVKSEHEQYLNWDNSSSFAWFYFVLSSGVLTFREFMLHVIHLYLSIATARAIIPLILTPTSLASFFACSYCCLLVYAARRKIPPKDESKTTTEKALEQGRYIQGDPLNGYYDFVITEGSYKFWVVFQVRDDDDDDFGLLSVIHLEMKSF